jgi:hypothetical protein
LIEIALAELHRRNILTDKHLPTDYPSATTKLHSMRTLWRSTASILRRYAVLWLPVAIAQFISFNLKWLDGAIRSRLMHVLMPWLLHSQSHSVLGGTIVVDSPAPEAMRKFIALTAPIQYGTKYLGDFLFACALIATAAILHSLVANNRGTLRDAATPISSSINRIAIYCLKLLAISVAANVVVSFLAPFYLSFVTHNGPEKLLHLSPESQVALASSTLFTIFLDHLWLLPITLCVVYVMAPIELHLLQPPDLLPTPGQKKQARLVAATAAIVISALAIAISAIEQNVFNLQGIAHSDQTLYWINTFASLVRAIPFAPLYIAFYLIATPDSPLALTPESLHPIPSPSQSPPESTSP